MLHPRAFVVLRTSVTTNLFLVINSLTVATPLRIVANLPVTNGLALRMDPEMAITTTTTTTNLLTPRKS